MLFVRLRKLTRKRTNELIMHRDKKKERERERDRENELKHSKCKTQRNFQKYKSLK
jgi:hypothetical protein